MRCARFWQRILHEGAQQPRIILCAGSSWNGVAALFQAKVAPTVLDQRYNFAGVSSFQASQSGTMEISGRNDASIKPRSNEPVQSASAPKNRCASAGMTHATTPAS